MKHIQKPKILICTMLLLVSSAFAQVSLNSVRVAAKDTAALAKFYQAAFGHERGESYQGRRRRRNFRQLWSYCGRGESQQSRAHRDYASGFG